MTIKAAGSSLTSSMTSTSTAALHARYRAIFPSFTKPYYGDNPLSISHGKGSYVWSTEDENNNNTKTRYLDFFGGILTTMIGHSHPKVIDAIQRQSEKVIHTSALYLHEPMITLAEKIADLSGIPDARLFFTPSGTEANDTAILLATSYRKSNRVLAMRNSYHGRSFTAQAITSHGNWRTTSLSGLDVHFVPGGPDMLRSPFRHLRHDPQAYSAACAKDLKQVIDMTGGQGGVACLIAEPIQGVGGFATPPDGFYGGAFRRELQKEGILFISDEVQTGWGRTGEHYWGYQTHCGKGNDDEHPPPDMITFAKGVGNGMPIAGVVARAEIMDSIKTTSFSTFGGNALSCVAALATLEAVEEEGMQSNALTMGRRLTDALRPVVESTPWIAELRGKGLMQAIEIVKTSPSNNYGAGNTDNITMNEPDATKAGELIDACRRHGLLVGRGGLYSNVVRISPMLNVTADEMDEGTTAILAAIAEVDAAGGGDADDPDGNANVA